MIALLVTEQVYLLLFLAGILLLAAEAVAPGAHFFVLGIALFTAGLVGMLLPGGLGLLAPLVAVVVAIGVTGVTLWGYRRSVASAKDGLAETSDSSSLPGQFGRVTERVTQTTGEVKLESGGFNPYYRARSTSGTIAEGEEVMVVDPGGGNVVTVEPVAGGDDIDQELARERERSATETVDDPDGSTAGTAGTAGESTPESESESDSNS